MPYSQGVHGADDFKIQQWRTKLQTEQKNVNSGSVVFKTVHDYIMTQNKVRGQGVYPLILWLHFSFLYFFIFFFSFVF